MEENKEVEFDEDVFDSMVYGSFEEPQEDEDEGVEEDVDDTELDNEDQEDTDQEDESEDDEELDEAGDGELDEDSEDLDEDEEEDSLVEDYDSDDEDSDDETEEDEDSSEEDNTDEESEDEADTEDPSDGEGQDTGGVDYKAFYDAVVNTEFTVNGKKVKGFNDPQKIIQSQQMAGGFSEKMAGFKQYRPFMAPLKERGMLEDQAKFDLAMNLIDGDKEAIKKHLELLDIDPLELDMEAISYEGKSAVATQESLVIEDTMERARAAGIEDRVRQVVGKDWDAESFQEFVSNDAVRNDLLSHIETGAYDKVQDKMLEMSRLDYTGAYGSMKTIDKYRSAVKELQAEHSKNPAPTKVKPTTRKPSVNSEKAKIEKARKDEEYKAKATEREAKLTKQRKRAASMSKKKPKVSKPKAKFDPLELTGEDFDKHMDFLISGGRQ